MTTGELIKKARKKRKMTQEQLAKKCNLATITIRQYESGKRTPGQEQLARIAKELDVLVIDLLDESEKRNNFFHKELVNFTCSFPHSVVFLEYGNVKSFVGSPEGNNDVELLYGVYRNFSELNEEGMKEAAKRIEELTHIPKYQRTETLPEVGEYTDTLKQEKPPEGEIKPNDGIKK